MPRRIETLIEESRWELPRDCFSETSRLPWSEQGRVLLGGPLSQPGGPLGSSPTPEDTDEGPSIYEGLPEGAIAETWPGDEGSLDQAIRTHGFEALAIYISFHSPLPDRTWGVFFLEAPMREFVRKIIRDVRVSVALANSLAHNIVLAHELVHFRFDVYALGEELTLSRPLYLLYQQNVYDRVLYTDDCWEEALANAGALQRARFVDNRVARAASAQMQWSDFVYRACKASPPGYSNVDVPKEEMQSHLGGQLRFMDPKATVPPASATWVASSQGFAPDDSCPLFVVQNNGVVRSKTRLTIPTRNGPWIVHKYDKDPWPSTPHAHHCDSGEKLDLGTGDVWDRNQQRARRLPRRELERIRDYVEAHWPDVIMPGLSSRGV
ncbi:MAG: hypothetical protein A2133_07235 [Actinobacteria bacterium RBG_16_64_13]|nr:MAG: hypothetical protein A2133_07235 [Actinobacteria bacterium RBG_16_64_13]